VNDTVNDSTTETRDEEPTTNSIGYPEFCPLECYVEEFAKSGGVAPSAPAKSASAVVSAWQPPQAYTYGKDFNPAGIPQRQWLLGHRRALAELTVTVGPPGTSKSTYT
jgi:hypothetical protein